MKEVTIKLAFKKIADEKWYERNRLVSTWTRSPYYHVELIINDYWISANESTGVTVNKLQPLKNNWEYMDVKTVKMTSEQIGIIIDWIRKQKTKEYDWLGIYLSQILPFTLHSNNKWFCSEICTKILQLFLVKEVLSLEPHTVSPGELADIFIKD